MILRMYVSTRSLLLAAAREALDEPDMKCVCRAVLVHFIDKHFRCMPMSKARRFLKTTLAMFYISMFPSMALSPVAHPKFGRRARLFSISKMRLSQISQQ